MQESAEDGLVMTDDEIELPEGPFEDKEALMQSYQQEAFRTNDFYDQSLNY